MTEPIPAPKAYLSIPMLSSSGCRYAAVFEKFSLTAFGFLWSTLGNREHTGSLGNNHKVDQICQWAR
jgi:hypothetical protein